MLLKSRGFLAANRTICVVGEGCHSLSWSELWTLVRRLEMRETANTADSTPRGPSQGHFSASMSSLLQEQALGRERMQEAIGCLLRVPFQDTKKQTTQTQARATTLHLLNDLSRSPTVIFRDVRCLGPSKRWQWDDLKDR